MELRDCVRTLITYETKDYPEVDIQREMVHSLSDRADRVRNKMVDPKEDNMLRITDDGRKLAAYSAPG